MPVTITCFGIARQHRFQHRQPLVAGAFDHDGVALVHAADAHPVHAVGQRLEQRELLGRERLGHAVQAGAGEDLHVLAVAAPEADPTFTGHVAVAVDAERRLGRQDLVDPDAIAFLHAEVGVGRELDDPADGLVAGDHGEHARVGDQLDALVGREVAAAEAAGLDPQHRAAGRRVGHRELPDLVLLVPEEDDGAAGVHALEYVRATRLALGLTLSRPPKLWGSGAGRGESAHAAVRRFSWASAGAVATCAAGVPFFDWEGSVVRATGLGTAVVSASMRASSARRLRCG